MPIYELQLRDGRTFDVEAPAGATKEQLASALSQQMMPQQQGPSAFDQAEEARMAEIEERQKAAQARLAEFDQPGITENILSGLGSGAVGLFESAALGAATLLNEGDETEARRVIQEAADAITPEGGDKEATTYKLAQGVGSILGFFPTILLGPAALPAAGALAVGAASGEASERARAAGATEEERSTAALMAAPVGLLEVTPLGRLAKALKMPVVGDSIDNLSETVVGGITDKIGAGAMREIGDRIANAAATGGLEGAQEAATEIAQNLIQQNVYDPTQDTFGGVGEALGIGGGSGAIVQALVDTFSGRRARTPAGEVDPTEGIPFTDDAGTDDLGVSPSDGRAGATAASEMLAALGKGRVDATPSATDDVGAGEAGVSAPLEATDAEKTASDLLTATQAVYDQRVSELLDSADGSLSVAEAEQQLAATDPKLAEDLQTAKDAVEEARIQTAEAKRQMQERVKQEEDAQAQREQPKTAETTVEKTTPEGETTVETTRTEEAKPADRPATRDDPVFFVAEPDADGKDKIVRKRKEEPTPEQVEAEIAKGEDPAIFETPAPAEPETVEETAAEPEPETVEEPTPERIPMRRAEEGEPIVQPKPEVEQRRQDTLNQVQGVLGFARKKQKTAEAMYRQAERLIRRQSVGFDTDQPAVTPEAFKKLSDDYARATQDVNTLAQASSSLTSEGFAAVQEGVAQTNLLDDIRKAISRVEAEQKLAKAEPDDPDAVDAVNYEIPDTLGPQDQNIIVGATRAGYPGTNERKLEPYNALRIYASKVIRAEDVINYLAYDIIYGSSKIVYQEGRAPAPSFKDQQPEPSITLDEVKAHVGEKDASKISPKQRDQARKELGEDPEYFKAREFQKGLGHRIVALKAVDYLNKNASPEVRKLLQQRVEAWRRRKHAGDAAMVRMGFDPDAAPAGDPNKILDQVELQRREDAKFEKEETKQLNAETTSLYNDLKKSLGIAGRGGIGRLLDGNKGQGGVLEGLNDYAIATVYNETVKLAEEAQFTFFGGSLAVTRAFESPAIQELIKEQRRLGRFKKNYDSKRTPLTREERKDQNANEITKGLLSTVATNVELVRREGDETALIEGDIASDIGEAAIPDADLAQLEKEGERFRFDATENYDYYDDTADVLADSGISLDLEQNAILASERPVHPSVYQAIKDGNLFLALKRLRQSVGNARAARILDGFMANVGSTKIELAPGLTNADGKEVAGQFDPATNTIRINPNVNVTPHTLMHEMSHAVTADAVLNQPNNIHVKRLRAIYNDLKDRLGTAYGAQSLAEFIAEFKSNENFVKEVARLSFKGRQISAAREIIRTIGNLLRSILRLPARASETTVAEIDALIDAIIDPAPYTSSNKPLYLNTNRDSLLKVLKLMGIDRRRAKNKKAKIRFAQRVASFFNSPIPDSVKRYFAGAGDLTTIAQIAEELGMGDVGHRVQRTVETQRKRTLESDRRVQEEVDNLALWLDSAGPEAEQRFNNLIYSHEFGATIFQVDPTKPRSAYDGKMAKDGVTELTVIWDLQRPVWNQLMNDVGKDGVNGHQLFTRLRDFYQGQRKSLIEVIETTMKDVMPGVQDAAVRKKLIERLVAEQDTLEVYFPLERQGRFMLSYNLNPNAVKAGIQPYVVRFFETKAERDAAAAELVNDPDAIKETIAIDDSQSIEQVLRKAPNNAFVTELLAALDKNPQVANDPALRDQVLTTFVSALPQTALARSLQKRQNILGYEKDALLALKGRAFEFGRQIERLQAVKELNAEQNKLNAFIKIKGPNQVKALVDANPNTPISAIARENNLTVPFIQRMLELADRPDGLQLGQKYANNIRVVTRELNDRIDFAREGAKNKSAEELVKYANQTAFLFTIGFNVSSFLVNMSQIPLFAYPFLGADYGYLAAGSAIKKATRQVGLFKNNIERFYERDAEGKFQVTAEVTDAEQRALLEELAPLVQEASGRGYLDQTYTADMLGLGEKKRFFDQLTGFSAFMFNHGERFNRQVALLSVYQLEIQRQKELNDKRPEGQKLADEVIKNRAIKNTLIQTQRLNGGTVLETGSRYAQQGIGRVALMYKSYGLRMYTTMFQAAREFAQNAFPGNDAESRRKRNVAFNQLIGVHISAALFAGVYGVPIYGAIQMAYDAVAGEDEDDFDTVVRKYLGELGFKGPINELTGLDVASRVRLTGLLIQENRYNSGASPIDNIMFYLGGPALSTGNRLYRGYEDIKDGELERGIENLMPASVSNAYKALGRYRTDGGIYTRRQDPIYADMSGGELAAQLFGLPPAEYTARQERNLRDKRVEKAVTTERTKLLRKYYVANRTGDADAALEALDQILEFNERHPYAAIVGDTVDKSMKQHMRSSLKMYDGVSISPIMQQAIEMSRREYGY